ncbi:MAG: tetratricopeptide repeat protein [Planctomycetes bacterium]|nr:tetratricopeptide repeat protein [Planctomycetota bacterium]
MRIRDAIAIVLSMLLPGTGHIAAGKPWKGVLIFFLFGFALDGWIYSQAATVLPPEHTVLSIPAVRNCSLALGIILWAFAVCDTAALALRHRRIVAKAEVAEGHIRNALIGHLRREPQAALKALRAALRINDQDPDAWFHLGVAYASLGQRRKARRALGQCIRYDHDGKWDTQAQAQLEALARGGGTAGLSSRGLTGAETRSDKPTVPHPEPPSEEAES